jgi:hypothetical protein
MKKAFEENDTASGASPSSPVKNHTPAKPKTPRTKAAKNTSSGDDVEATPTPKRKRASAKKKVTDDDDGEVKFKPEPEIEDDDDLLDVKPKRPKATPKPKVAPKPKNGTVKNEVIDDEEEDTFFDAPEQPDAQCPTDDMFSIETEAKNERKSSTPSRTGSTFTSKFLQHRAEYY